MSTELYKCTDCGELHDDVHDAAFCCDLVEAVFQCDTCKTTHNDEENADAFSARERAEEVQPDGSVTKKSVFRHKGFVIPASESNEFMVPEPPAIANDQGKRGEPKASPLERRVMRSQH